jgi:hypothetical protein
MAWDFGSKKGKWSVDSGHVVRLFARSNGIAVAVNEQHQLCDGTKALHLKSVLSALPGYITSFARICERRLARSTGGWVCTVTGGLDIRRNHRPCKSAKQRIIPRFIMTAVPPALWPRALAEVSTFPSLICRLLLQIPWRSNFA